jgi:hypothetical protein
VLGIADNQLCGLVASQADTLRKVLVELAEVAGELSQTVYANWFDHRNPLVIFC